VRVFYKNQVNLLQKVLENCDQQCPQEKKYFADDSHSLNQDEKTELEQRLTKDLKHHELNFFFKAELKKTEKWTLSGKKNQWDIKYVLAENLKKFLGGGQDPIGKIYAAYTIQDIKNNLLSNDNLSIIFSAAFGEIEVKENKIVHLTNTINNCTKEQLEEIKKKIFDRCPDDRIFENLMIFAKLAPLFINAQDEIDEELTISQSRKQFYENLDKFNVKKAASGVYNTAVMGSFNFWLAFMAFDIINDQGDTRQWSLTSQWVTIAVGVGYLLLKGVVHAFRGLTKIGRKIANFVKKSSQGEENEELLTAATKGAGREHIDDSLKHRQLERLYIEDAYAFQKKFVQNSFHHNKTEPNDILKEDATSVIENKKGFFSRLAASFFSEVDSAKQCREFWSSLEWKTLLIYRPKK
jgi:hypothetical protein